MFRDDVESVRCVVVSHLAAQLASQPLRLGLVDSRTCGKGMRITLAPQLLERPKEVLF